MHCPNNNSHHFPPLFNQFNKDKIALRTDATWTHMDFLAAFDVSLLTKLEKPKETADTLLKRLKSSAITDDDCAAYFKER
jgi:hypothetical protein